MRSAGYLRVLRIQAGTALLRMSYGAVMSVNTVYFDADARSSSMTKDV
jgi:hypothetical protein